MSDSTRNDILQAVGELRATAETCDDVGERESGDELRALASRLERIACEVDDWQLAEAV